MTEESSVTIRTDAALTRRVTGARLVTASAVLGGALALAGLGAFAQPQPPAAGNVGPGISTVELAQPISGR
jgi:Pyruvate/2-oxoacid:ferredoxin oxidoreductase gamma subunit